MTVTDPRPPQATSQHHPVAEALRTQDTFDRTQVAWLIAAAFQSGYELRESEDRGWVAGYNARVAEENMAWPPPKVTVFGRWYEQATERARADAAARLPRPHDFKGCDPRPARVAA